MVERGYHIVEQKKLVPREIENCLIGRWTYITNKLLHQILNDGVVVVSLVLSLCVYVTQNNFVISLLVLNESLTKSVLLFVCLSSREIFFIFQALSTLSVVIFCIGFPLKYHATSIYLPVGTQKSSNNPVGSSSVILSTVTFCDSPTSPFLHHRINPSTILRFP